MSFLHGRTNTFPLVLHFTLRRTIRTSIRPSSCTIQGRRHRRGYQHYPDRHPRHRISSINHRCSSLRQYHQYECGRRTVATDGATATNSIVGNDDRDSTESLVHSIATATATCLPGLEKILKKELDALISGGGSSVSRRSDRPSILHGVGVMFPMLDNHQIDDRVSDSKLQQPDEQTLLNQINSLQSACLFLGTASNVRIKCGPTFNARKLPELRRKISKIIDWKKILKLSSQTSSLDGTPNSQPQAHEFHIQFNTRVVSKKSKLYHTGAIRERVMGGIQDALNSQDDDDDNRNHHDDRHRHGKLEQNKAEKTNQMKVVCSEYNSETAGHADDVGGGIDNHDNGRSNKKDVVLSLDVEIAWDSVDVFLKAYPMPLHKRGYRFQTAKAPLREDIAYAMLLSSGWIVPSYDRVQSLDVNNEKHGIKHAAQWQQQSERRVGLMDPFCGSGTIAIEGAAMMLGLPPGRLKGCPFEGTIWGDQRLWNRLVHEAMAKASIRAGYSKNVVFASDRDAGAVEATRHNAERAGVLGLKGDVEGIFDFQHSSLMGQPWFQEPASDSVPEAILICTNPPFGKRIGASTKQQSSNGLLSLYQTLGKQILHFSAGGKATKCVIITDDLKLAHRIGLPAKSRMLFRTKHGGIDVCALSWEVGPDCKE